MVNIIISEAHRKLLEEPGVQTKLEPLPDYLGGNRLVVHFPNNWGASIIKHRSSYGTELAVLRFENAEDMEGDIRYAGWLDLLELGGLLEQIRQLHPDRQSIPGRRGTAAENEEE